MFMDGAFLHAGRLACFPPSPSPSPSLCPACSPCPFPWSDPPYWRLVLTPRNARTSGSTSLSLVYGGFMAAWAVTGMSTTLPKGMPARKAPDCSASQHPHTLASPLARLGVQDCSGVGHMCRWGGTAGSSREQLEEQATTQFQVKALKRKCVLDLVEDALFNSLDCQVPCASTSQACRLAPSVLPLSSRCRLALLSRLVGPAH